MRRLAPYVNLAIAVGLAAACASTPTVELAAVPVPVLDAAVGEADTVEADTVEADTVEADAPTAPPTTALAEPPRPETTPSTTSQRLLAGGVDPDTLITTADGGIAVQPTPEPLRDRRLATTPTLPDPPDQEFTSEILPLAGEALDRSTWNPACPVPAEDLRYVLVSFWGFDDETHTGELIVAASEAEGVVSVFRTLHDIRFPIEEMRIVTPLDVVAGRTGDGNNTASFVCRFVTGGSRFSEHAYGLAIDINPFHNPYHRADVVIPALASSYLERDLVLPGMIVPGDPSSDVVLAAFAEIGWSWGGSWSSLKDYQHFSKHNR